MDIATQILNGKLELPSQELFQQQFGYDLEPAKRMFKAAWHNYLLNKGSISLTYWAEQFSSPTNFNAILAILATNGWFETHSIPARNWAEASLREDKLLQYVTPDELAHVRATLKFAKYIPEKLESTKFNLTKQNGKVRNTGLVRYGFRASASTEFSYDVDMLNKYKDSIILNTIKGMQKVRERFPDMASDEASYDAVSTAIVEALANSNGTYSMGNNYSDSRGRSIKEGLSKVGNPIGYKDFRAMLVIPEEYRILATEEGASNVYLFIAELLGFKGGTPTDKELFGVQCYKKRKFHDLITYSRNVKDLTYKELTELVGKLEQPSEFTDEELQLLENKRAEKDRSELHENIWLERLYDELDGFYNNTEWHWSTPIELDASALT